MKDAYSFHTSQEDLDAYYQKVLESYGRIYKRVGLRNVVAIESDTGMMGGQKAHEFMYLSDGGEDTIVLCDQCGYQSNMEVAVSSIQKEPCEERPMEEVHTPGVRDIEALTKFLSVPESRTMKATVFSRRDNKIPVVVFVRGDLQVNEVKLKKILGTEVDPLTDYEGVDLCFGYIGAYHLNAEGIQVLYDKSLEGETNLACGANRKDYHIRGVSVPRDLDIREFVDVAKVKEGDACVKCGGPLKVRRGIEAGNIFQLGTKYTKSMGMQYMDENGTLQTPLMGCYGIGVGRLLACVLEDNHDEYGPIWPKSVAPWLIHICMLNDTQEGIRELGFRLYQELGQKWDTLLDDRGAAAGVQFADADLLGAPVRIILSKRNIARGQVEITTRDKRIKTMVSIEEVSQKVGEILDQ